MIRWWPLGERAGVRLKIMLSFGVLGCVVYVYIHGVVEGVMDGGGEDI